MDEISEYITQGAMVLREYAALRNHHSEIIDEIVLKARMLHKFRFGNTIAHQVMYEIDMMLMLDHFEQGVRE